MLPAMSRTLPRSGYRLHGCIASTRQTPTPKALPVTIEHVKSYHGVITRPCALLADALRAFLDIYIDMGAPFMPIPRHVA